VTQAADARYEYHPGRKADILSIRLKCPSPRKLAGAATMQDLHKD
jgi:hypothetical protein